MLDDGHCSRQSFLIIEVQDSGLIPDLDLKLPFYSSKEVLIVVV